MGEKGATTCIFIYWDHGLRDWQGVCHMPLGQPFPDLNSIVSEQGPQDSIFLLISEGFAMDESQAESVRSIICDPCLH